MTAKNLEKRLTDSIAHLDKAQKIKLLHFIESVLSEPSEKKPKNPLLQFAGAIPASDLIQMEKAIEKGCENIDENEW